MSHRINGKAYLDILVSVFFISVLVAIGAPRFLHLKKDAHRANNEGTAAALHDAIFHLQKNTKESAEPHYSQQGYVLTLNEKGYPIGVGEVGLEPGREGNAACRDLLRALLPSPTISVRALEDNPSKIYLYVAIAEEHGCRFVYQESTPENGSVYVVRYDAKTGKISTAIEEA